MEKEEAKKDRSLNLVGSSRQVAMEGISNKILDEIDSISKSLMSNMDMTDPVNLDGLDSSNSHRDSNEQDLIKETNERIRYFLDEIETYLTYK